MKAIWKFVLPLTGKLEKIPMPAGAEILTLQIQGDCICMWAIVDTLRHPEPRYFRIYGTGHEIEPGAIKYVGTFQLRGGLVVFHVFEVEAPPKGGAA